MHLPFNFNTCGTIRYVYIPAIRFPTPELLIFRCFSNTVLAKRLQLHMKSKESNKSPEKSSAILLIRKPMQLISNSQAAPVPSQVTQTADPISTTGIWGAHAVAAAAADRIVFLLFRFCFVCVCVILFIYHFFPQFCFSTPLYFVLFHVRLFFSLFPF